ncbi:hypothetical protein DSO57_1005391 [Entomophthora muscae]|uniref:Uncharacterized protein n=1 Tax=Entomophthora muscae TaxID=34485 RepID=A0ACC2RZ44_9FUNG|nr:hypothetical protein DSO57_1005391 [Entomophthora muscae]
MKFTEELSLPSLGFLRSSSSGTTIVKPVLVFQNQDLAGSSACKGSVSGKRRRASPWSMGLAACKNTGSGFESYSWVQVSREKELSILTEGLSPTERTKEEI